MSKYENFKHLVLLIGTNPLPSFVVADYFLRTNSQVRNVWLVHSEENLLQGGTGSQAANLEGLIRKRWENKHPSLKFPLEKISLSDVSDAVKIRSEIENKMLKRWNPSEGFHLDYTGGTKAMAIHIYVRLQELKNYQQSFSYLDANNFRLIGDDQKIIADKLRDKVSMEFAELIALHGFIRANRDEPSTIDKAEQERLFDSFINTDGKDLKDGRWLETYLAEKIRNKMGHKLNDNNILQNWKIKKNGWGKDFELDVILLYGYHLVGLSCTIGRKTEKVKLKGVEIIQRCRQIGGDEARSIIVGGLDQGNTEMLQKELEYESGGARKNILALGIADLRNENIYLKKIENFVFN
ncbi:MAG: hypothetical protein HY819_22440 [Acidobacteria bacterium]|nr:hypothetical protein [Acidobacteriota bacterium]